MALPRERLFTQCRGRRPRRPVAIYGAANSCPKGYSFEGGNRRALFQEAASIGFPRASLIIGSIRKESRNTKGIVFASIGIALTFLETVFTALILLMTIMPHNAAQPL